MKYLWTGLVLLFGVQVHAQVLRGNVKGEGDKGQFSPILGAGVHWSDTSVGAVTDEQGSFEIEIPEGANSLVASAIGFENDTIPFTGQVSVQFNLRRSVELIGAAQVEGETNTTRVSLIDPLNTQVMSERELAKAACCNLSESFETNASIDASFTDAVTGTRQIRMLGLDGKYTQLMQDVVPSIRGLSAITGLTYIPGPWIESIQISKGVGSVSNGYESMTGQINVSMKNPENAEKFYLNAYGNQGGRTELNVAWNTKVSQRFSTIFQTHLEWNGQRMDQNGDGFLDNPLKQDLILRNAWKYRALETGWEGEYQVQYLSQDRTSGQFNYRRDDELAPVGQRLWGAAMRTSDLFAYAKTGHVWLGQPWKSFGSQLSFNRHEQDGNFGLRQYNGVQTSFRANLLFASNFKNADHTFFTGASFQYDDFAEDLDSLSFQRTEYVPGAFFEYTWKNKEVFTLVAGMRADYHNLFGLFLSPRMHFRYSLTETTAVKLAAGKGYRTSSILMEHVGVLASNRTIFVNDQNTGAMPNLDPEETWNFGVNLTHKFQLNYRDASLTADFYRTEFVDQVVMDLEDPGAARFYNLNGDSWSNSAQVEFNWTPRRRVDLRLAYRWLEVKTQYLSGFLSKPLVNQHRAFANIAYETKPNDKKGQWKFDLTGNWIGESRIPYTGSNPEEFQLAANSDSYVLMHAQVTRVFSEAFEFYVGGENLTNFRQPNPILSAEDPFNENFDASLVWGPVFGRMVYAGLRWRIE